MDRIVKAKNGVKRRAVLWTLITIAFTVLLYGAFTRPKVSTYRISRDILTIDTVRSGVFIEHLRIQGYVEPIISIYLDAPEAGRVIQRYVEEGAMVRQGQMILNLENREMLQSVLEAEAQFNEKQNALRHAVIRMEKEGISLRKELLLQDFEIRRKKRYFEQNQLMAKDGLLSREEFVRSQEDYDYAVQLKQLILERVRQDSLHRRLEIQQLEDNLKIAEKNLQFIKDRAANLQVKAPVAGQLSTLEAEMGQTIARGSRIGQINILDDFKIRADIGEHYIDRITKNLTATLDRNGKLYPLRIRKVYPEVRNGNFQVDFVFSESRPDNIRNGQSYYLKLNLGAPQTASLLSRGGFFTSTGGQWVYLLHPEGLSATKRSIRIGKQNPQYYQILEGLQAGDRVITSGYDGFGDSDRIVLE